MLNSVLKVTQFQHGLSTPIPGLLEDPSGSRQSPGEWAQVLSHHPPPSLPTVLLSQHRPPLARWLNPP